MIDKQKFLTWIDDTYEVASHPADESDTAEEKAKWKAEAALMYKLRKFVEFGYFDVKEEVAHERSEASSPSVART